MVSNRISQSGISTSRFLNIIELNGGNAIEVDDALCYSDNFVILITDDKGLSPSYVQRLIDSGRTVVMPYRPETRSDGSEHRISTAKTVLAAAAMILLAVLTSASIILMPAAGVIVDQLVTYRERV